MGSYMNIYAADLMDRRDEENDRIVSDFLLKESMAYSAPYKHLDYLDEDERQESYAYHWLKAFQWDPLIGDIADEVVTYYHYAFSIGSRERIIDFVYCYTQDLMKYDTAYGTSNAYDEWVNFCRWMNKHPNITRFYIYFD